MFVPRSALAVFAATLLASAASAADLKFEIFKDKEGKFRWRLLEGEAELGNGGQGYQKKSDAANGVDRMQKDAAGDDAVKFEVYEDNAKKFRWRAKVKNGNIIASSAKGYEKKADAEAVVKLIKEKVAKAQVVEAKEDK